MAVQVQVSPYTQKQPSPPTPMHDPHAFSAAQAASARRLVSRLAAQAVQLVMKGMSADPAHWNPAQ